MHLQTSRDIWQANLFPHGWKDLLKSHYHILRFWAPDAFPRTPSPSSAPTHKDAHTRAWRWASVQPKSEVLVPTLQAPLIFRGDSFRVALTGFQEEKTASSSPGGRGWRILLTFLFIICKMCGWYWVGYWYFPARMQEEGCPQRLECKVLIAAHPQMTLFSVVWEQEESISSPC